MPKDVRCDMTDFEGQPSLLPRVTSAPNFPAPRTMAAGKMEVPILVKHGKPETTLNGQGLALVDGHYTIDDRKVDVDMNARVVVVGRKSYLAVILSHDCGRGEHEAFSVLYPLDSLVFGALIAAADTGWRPKA